MWSRVLLQLKGIMGLKPLHAHPLGKVNIKPILLRQQTQDGQLNQSGLSGPGPHWNFTSEKPSSPPARARNLSYARAVLASSGTSPAAFSGNFPSPQSLSFVEPVRDNGRVKVIPPKGISEEGKGDWENTLVGHFLGQKPH